MIAVARLFLATPIEAQGKSGKSGSSVSGSATAQAGNARVDAMIPELLGTGNDDGQLRVIVTVKPGAKTGLIKR